MEKAFLSSEFKADDLHGYCRKLEALGNAISALGFHENNGGSDALTTNGEELGRIISDYASTAQKALDSAYGVLNKFFGGDNSSLGYDVSTAHAAIKRMKDQPMALEAIGINLKKIESASFDKLPAEDIMLVMNTRNGLLRLRESILECQSLLEQKGAPATAGDQAEAPDTDLNRSTIQ